MTRISAVLVACAVAAPAAAQPTTGEKDTAAKIDCADFKSTGNGAWTGKDGKTYAKSDHMAIALQQKCTGGKK